MHLRLGEEGGALVPLVRVFIKDGGMMLAWVFAAFDHKQDEVVELAVRVVGIVSMCGSLAGSQHCHITDRPKFERLTQLPFFSIILARQCAPAATKLGGLPTRRSSMIVISRKYLANVRVSRS